MNPYALSLAIGATGIAVMALRGLGAHGAHLGHGGQTAPGSGPGGHAPAGHGHGGHAHPSTGSGKVTGDRFLALLSPRTLFSFLVGFGATGLVVARFLVEPLGLGAAVVGGFVFERFLVRPLWNFLLRFESAPAATLESALLEEARAAMDFDARGEGLISVEVDGQVLQLLGTLRAEDRHQGIKVRRGGRIRIEEVDPGRNRCVVSYLGEGSTEESA